MTRSRKRPSETHKHGLSQVDDKYRNILESLEDGYYEIDLVGDFIDCNQAMCEILGRTREQLPGMNFSSFMDTENAHRALHVLNTVFETGEAQKAFDYEIIRSTGDRRTISVSVSPVIDARGRFTGFRGISRDMTEQKHTEERLAHNVTRFQGLYDLAVAMTAEKAPYENLALVVEQSRSLLKADTSYIALRDEESGDVYMHTLAGIRTDAFKRLRIPFGKGLGGRVSQTGKGSLIEDYFDEVEPLLHDVVRAEGLVSGIAVPLTIGSTNLGVLYVFNRSRTAFSEEDLFTLTLLGNLAAVEITRQRSQDQLRKAHNDLEVRVAERTREVLKTNEALRREIANRREAQSALSEREAMLRSILATSPVGICLTRDRIIKWTNPEWDRLFGFESEGEYVGKNTRMLYDSEEEFNRIGRELFGRLSGGAVTETDARFIRKNGTPFDAHIRATFLDPNDETKGTISAISDISERKRTEIALRDSEERYRQLVDNAPVGIAVHTDGIVVFVNEAGAQMLRGRPEEFIGKPVLDVVHPSIRDRAREGIEDMVRRGKDAPLLEQRWLRKDGTTADLQVAASRIVYNGKTGIQAVFTDITELKEARRALRSEKEKFEALAEHAPFGILMMGESGAFQYFNPKFRELFGYDLETVPNGSAWLKRAFPDKQYRQQAFAEWMERSQRADTGEVEPSTWSVRCNDGSDRIVHFRVARIEGGGYMVTGEDITSLMRTKEALSKSEEKYRSLYAESKRAEELYHRLLNSSADAVIAYDMNARPLFVSPSFTFMFGWTQEEADEFSVTFEEHAGEGATDRLLQRLMFNVETVSGLESTRKTKDGRALEVSISAGLFYDHEGRPSGMLVILSDITERKEAERALAESERRYRVLVETARDVIWTIDLDLNYTYMSPSVTDVLGYTVEEITAKHPLELVTRASREHLLKTFEEALEAERLGQVQEGGPRFEECEQFHKDGSTRWIEMTMTFIRDTEGKPNGILGISRDITDRKNAERELERALTQARQLRAEAEAANLAKSEFLANMSHELRTPLNAVIGFSELLKERALGSLSEEQHVYVSQILGAGEHLLRLINDILDLAKVESGKMELQCSEIGLKQLFDSVLGMIRDRAHRGGLEISRNMCAESSDARIMADSVKMKQILFNLLSNAAKFSDRGGRIVLESKLTESALEIAVTDTGIGIASEDQERIFAAFEQVDSSYSRRQPGTGLGLALTRRMVELHGGTITVESEGLGTGACFVITIPVLKKPLTDGCLLLVPTAAEASMLSPVSQAATGIDTPGSAILVVDDDPDIREIFEHYLTREGFSVLHACNGEEALALAKQYRPLAITMDVLMPKKGGFEALIELKEDPLTRDIPVVMVSVSVDRDFGMALGAADFVLKPVDGPRLVNTIKQHLPTKTDDPERVLVIDDDPSMVELITRQLCSEGFRAIRAVGGREGVSKAVDEIPDAIVLDLLMPDMPGTEVIDRLRSNAVTRHIPILVYTAKDLTSDDYTRLREHVQGLASKSGGKKELMSHLRRLRERKTLL